MVNYMSNFR